MKFLVRFFTHWTKKKIVVCSLTALVLAGASFGATRLFGKGGLASVVKPSSFESTMEAKPAGKTVADFASDENAKYNLFVAQKVLHDAGSFRSVTNGKSESTVFGVKAVQEIYAERVVYGNSVYKDSRSYGKYVKFADERFAHDGHYLYRNTGNLSSIKKVNSWGDPKNFRRDSDKSEEEAQNRYLSRYGCLGNGMSSYILREETITSAKYSGRDDDGNYVFEYDLNISNSENGACYCILQEMRTNAGTENFATFKSAKLIVTMDGNWVVKQIENKCHYSVPKVVKDGADTYEHMLEVFDNIGAYKSAKELPKYAEFEKKFNSTSAGGEEPEKTAVSVLGDMFGAYLGEKPLNAKLTLNVNGKEVVANVTARIDTSDLAKTSVIAKIGDKLFVSYNNGYVAISYDELKLKLSIDDVKALIGKSDDKAETAASVEESAEDGAKEDGETDILSGILENMTLTENADGTCDIVIPVELGSFKIKVTVSGKKKVISTDKNGKEKYTYELTGANAEIGDVATAKLELVETELKALSEEELKNFADLKSVLSQFVGKDELSLKVDTGLKLGGKSLVAYVKANITDKQVIVNVPDLFGADAILKIDGSRSESEGGANITVNYGKLNVVLPFDKIGSLVELVKDNFGEELGALTDKLATIKDIDVAEIFAIISTVEIKKTETGYRLSINLGKENENKTLVAEVTADGGIKDLTVKYGDYSVGVSGAGDYEFTDVSDGESVDLVDLAEKAITSLLPLIKNEGGYAIDLSGVKLTLGNNVYAVNGSVKIDAKKNIAVNAQITLNGKPFAKADIKIVDGTIYGEVNGYKFAAKIARNGAVAQSGENAKATFDFDKLKGYNAYLDEIAELIKKFTTIDFKSLEYGKMIDAFGFDAESGELTLELNGETFGLGEIKLSATLGKENVSVSLANANITDNVSVSVGNVKLSATADEITAPAANEDYTTNLLVRVDDNNAIYARLDFIKGKYSFDLVSGTDDNAKNLSVEYDGSERTVYVKCGNAFVKCPIDKIGDITDELKRLAHPLLNEAGGQSAEERVETSATLIAFIKDLTDDLEISSDENGSNIVTSICESLKNLLDISINVRIGDGFETCATVIAVQLNNKTMLVRNGDCSHKYADFPAEKCIDIAEVFEDYKDTLKKLADVSKGGEELKKSWTFTLGSMNVAVKGKEYSVSLPENLKLSFSKNLTVVDVPKLVLVTDGKTKTFRLKFAYAKSYNADGTINEDESRLYVTFNDLTIESSDLKFSVSKTVLAKIVKEDLPGVLSVVPQIGEMLSGNIGLSNVVNLATLVSNATYDRENDKAISVTIGGDALITGLGNITLTISNPKDGAVKLDVRSENTTDEAQNIELRDVSLTVAADEEFTDIGYATDGHTNLDSLQTLLRSFVNTANRASYRLVGNVPVHLSALGIVNADVTIGVDLKIDIEKRKGQSDVVYIALKLSRTNLNSTAKIAFNDEGGYSYLFFDNVSNTVTIKRNSLNTYKYCTKCGSFNCKKSALHWGLYFESRQLTDVQKNNSCGYDVTVSAEEFKSGMVNYLMEMINFIDSIKNAITGATSSKAFGIDDILTGYSYGNSAFTLNVDLKPIDDVLGSGVINIRHNADGELVSLDGNLVVLNITGVSCTGTFDISLAEAIEGDAKTTVQNKTLF
ncbi:MAG: hypothetical protein PUI94_01155 [Eubacteriales bacterium]|nr:hypothetical protein [Eubacteriales bacterium]